MQAADIAATKTMPAIPLLAVPSGNSLLVINFFGIDEEKTAAIISRTKYEHARYIVCTLANPAPACINIVHINAVASAISCHAKRAHPKTTAAIV